MTKKIILLFSFIFMASCTLDIPVEDEITGFNAIDNSAIANETLSSIYNAIPKDNLSFSILSDDFFPNHTIDDNKDSYQFYLWYNKGIKKISYELWNSYYDVNCKANLLLSRIPYILKKNPKQIKQLEFIKAQALCLKAFSYFKLIELYCNNYSEQTKNDLGIILKDKIESEQLPRSTLENSYLKVEKLLKQAIELFDNKTKNKLRFSKLSAKVLLSKVYFNWNKYDKSIKIVNEIITKHPLNYTDFIEIWKNKSIEQNALEKNNEVFLFFENKNWYFTPIIDKDYNYDEFYINTNIKYLSTDIRFSSSIIINYFVLSNNTKIKARFIKKYRDNLFDKTKKPLIILRNAELYFIKAESLYHLGRENEARNFINKFTNYRKSYKITSSGKNLLLDILKEKQREFLGEGNRYFDLKRNNIKFNRVDYKKHKVINTILSNDYKWLFPLPKTEIKENKNVKQNPNWD